MRESVDPNIFYRDIRPWFVGSIQDGGESGWVYEGVKDLGSIMTQVNCISPPNALARVPDSCDG
ncbi:hypothetical protein B0H14DRAFT_2976896 [Mycena olivaceomarginata]|nr:hypothetical protein B0H14DRAFT_2976896 [Mycena olivaceomarginata]